MVIDVVERPAMDSTKHPHDLIRQRQAGDRTIHDKPSDGMMDCQAKG
jgi:hypothetical protein